MSRRKSKGEGGGAEGSKNRRKSKEEREKVRGKKSRKSRSRREEEQERGRAGGRKSRGEEGQREEKQEHGHKQQPYGSEKNPQKINKLLLGKTNNTDRTRNIKCKSRNTYWFSSYNWD
ncbi:hypothetical protein EGW08_001756 [Elysia chlorotica]|uniref:Uncharacterized protein n=1 Tax=Elysia chlorotica TaxID=188477 RepID=A0A433U9L3_ELYCH|nr:hypothetical protein EGW08_001756 [Elysia chlorotica]